MDSLANPPRFPIGRVAAIRLMDEIRLTSWYGKYPIVYRVLYIPGGAGFLLSTVSVNGRFAMLRPKGVVVWYGQAMPSTCQWSTTHYFLSTERALQNSILCHAILLYIIYWKKFKKHSHRGNKKERHIIMHILQTPVFILGSDSFRAMTLISIAEW